MASLVEEGTSRAIGAGCDENPTLEDDSLPMPIVQEWIEMLFNLVSAAQLPHAHRACRAEEYSSRYGSRYSKFCQLYAADETISISDKSEEYTRATELSFYICSSLFL